MATAYIGLGSNIEPERNLAAAIGQLGEVLNITAVSPVYRTAPWGVTDQPDFFNAAACAESALTPLELLDALQGIEARLGRKRERRWGPRGIDLDLLLYGDLVLGSARLTLPHPLLHERAFALKPLCDLAPGLLHPVLGRSMADLLAELDEHGIAGVPLRLGLG